VDRGHRPATERNTVIFFQAWETPENRLYGNSVIWRQKNYQAMLDIAIQESQVGPVRRGHFPLAPPLFHDNGTLLGRGHNRRGSRDKRPLGAWARPMRFAGPVVSDANQDTIMVTTLCALLVLQRPLSGSSDHESNRGRVVHVSRRDRLLREHGVEVIDMQSKECEGLLTSFIARNPDVWNEDIGECQDTPFAVGPSIPPDLRTRSAPALAVKPMPLQTMSQKTWDRSEAL